MKKYLTMLIVSIMVATWAIGGIQTVSAITPPDQAHPTTDIRLDDYNL